jgi:mono/diheme cytochrome c family protein
MSIQIKATVLALTAGVGVLGVAFGLSPLLQPGRRGPVTLAQATNVNTLKFDAAPNGSVEKGHQLFDHSCAHCHGDDARGDEGPDLHGLVKSDARIGSIIKTGIKGEMPAFAKKFNDTDVQDLIAYLRTLND